MSVVVIDVGCATYGGDASIPYLIEEFSPSKLIGLDPNLTGQEPAEVAGVELDLRRAAAWTSNGTIGFTPAGLSGHIGGLDAITVEAVDLAALILAQPDDHDVILKLDCEGAEYLLIPELVARDVDLRLRLAWVEWHCLACGRGGGGHREGCRESRRQNELRVTTEAMMRCDMHTWNR